MQKTEGRRQKALNRLFCILPSAFSLLVSCTTPAPPPPPVPAPMPPHLTASGVAKRVVLVSFDGLGADEVQRFGAPALEQTPARGPPREGGAKGLDSNIGVDTIVDVARRAGKRVGSIAFPFYDWASPRHMADFGIGWSMPLTRPRILHLARNDFHADWLPPMWGSPASRHASYSPVLRTRIEWSAPNVTAQDVDLVAYDSTNDNTTNYDTFFVEARGVESPVDAKRWFAVSEQGFGSWSKILSFDPALASCVVQPRAADAHRVE